MRGAALLLVHCAPVAEERESAYARLERALGRELARLLVSALSGTRRVEPGAVL